ncbi:MAG: arginase family protein [Pseudolysinimonas sp.]
MPIVVLDAPSNLGLRPGPGGVISGVDRLAATVRAAGLLEKIQDAVGAPVTDAGAVEVPAYDLSGWHPGRDPYNAAAICEFTVRLADRVEELVVSTRPSAYSTGGVVVVLGGDCSILLGPALALARIGTPGLVFIDAHGDFRHPGNAPHVDALAGEELAVVTGRGGHALTDLEGRGPLFDDSRVAVLGLHDPEELPSALPFPTVMTVADVRAAQPAVASGHALDAVLAAGATDVWVHVDADVIDPAYLPAVDSPEPGGLHPDEFVALLQPLLAHPMVRGIDLCIYDPALDTPDAPGAALLADLVGRAFARSTSV